MKILPNGVKKQVDLFHQDYPKTGKQIAARYLRLLTSDEYIRKSTEKSENKNTEKGRKNEKR